MENSEEVDCKVVEFGSMLSGSVEGIAFGREEMLDIETDFV